MSKARFVIPSPQDDRFKDTVFLVNANSFERHSLWSELKERVTWEDQIGGVIGQIGTLGGRPVTLQVFWARIDGRLVAFWESPSEVVDYKMVREWFDQNCDPKWDGGSRRARCDAMNFHHCINAICEMNEREVVGLK